MSERDPVSGPPELPDDEDLGRLYRSLPAEEPRAELDRRILDAARRATVTPLAPRRSMLRRAIFVPFAAAAGIALTLLLTEQAQRERERQATLAQLDDRITELENERETMSTKMAKTTRDRELEEKAARSAAAPAAPAAGAPAPAPQESDQARSARDALAPQQRQKEASPNQESLRNLGYLGGAEAPGAAPAPPPAVASSPPPAKEADSYAAAEAAKPAEARGGAATAREDLAATRQAAPAAEPLARAAGPEAKRRAQPGTDVGVRWPLDLEPGLDAAESCRRIVAALGSRPCELEDDRIHLTIDPPLPPAAGPMRHGRVLELVAEFREGKLLRFKLLHNYGDATDWLYYPSPADFGE